MASPLFTAEGPQFYGAAYAHNRPFAVTGTNYRTALTPAQERQFRTWVQQNRIEFDPNAKVSDYDMRGYWLSTQGRVPTVHERGGLGYPDTFKTPYDTTFSRESQYATPTNPFAWNGNTLVDQRNGQVVFGSAPSPESTRAALIGALHAALGAK